LEIWQPYCIHWSVDWPEIVAAAERAARMFGARYKRGFIAAAAAAAVTVTLSAERLRRQLISSLLTTFAVIR